MRVGPLLCVAAAFATGCDRVLGLTPFPDAPQYPAHFITDPGGDYDHDGIANEKDLCPTDPDNQGAGGGVDTDNDGVGDLCDPHPDVPGDCLVLFDDFGDAPTSLDSWRGAGGPLSIIMVPGDAGNMVPVLQFDQTDEEIVSLEFPLDLDAVALHGYVQSGDQFGQNTYAAVEVFVDLTLSRMPIAANGTSCAFESMGPPSKVEHMETVAGVDTPQEQATIGPETVGQSTPFELVWSPAAGGCYAHLTFGSNADANRVPLDVPTSGTFAVRGRGVGLYLYAVAGWGHSCGHP